MPDIRHQLIIGATAAKVYNTLTLAEGLSAWWTPFVTALPQVNSNAIFPFGANYYKEMQITHLQPAEKVLWQCTTGDTEWLGTTISFTLLESTRVKLLKNHPEIAGQLQQQDGDTLTLLQFAHNDWAGYTPMFAECNYTWGRFLRSLKLYCETGKGTPWPFQHRTEI